MQNRTIYLVAGVLIAVFVAVGIAVVANLNADNNGVTLSSEDLPVSGAEPDTERSQDREIEGSQSDTAQTDGGADDFTACLADLGLDLDDIDGQIDPSDFKVDFGTNGIIIEFRGQQFTLDEMVACIPDFGELGLTPDDLNLDDLDLDDLNLDDLNLDDLNLDGLLPEDFSSSEFQECLDAVAGQLEPGDLPQSALENLPESCRELLGI